MTSRLDIVVIRESELERRWRKSQAYVDNRWSERPIWRIQSHFSAFKTHRYHEDLKWFERVRKLNINARVKALSVHLR